MRTKDYYVIFEYDPDEFPPIERWKDSDLRSPRGVLIHQVHGATSEYDACERFIGDAIGDTNNMRILYVGRMPSAGDGAVRLSPVRHERNTKIDHTFEVYYS